MRAFHEANRRRKPEDLDSRSVLLGSSGQITDALVKELLKRNG